DRSAAEYRLRKGDVEWWDFHRWRGAPQQEEVVPGAFPEPLLHGFDGKTRSTVVLYHFPGHGKLAREIGRIVHASLVESDDRAPPKNVNVVLIEATGGISAANDGRLYGPYTITIGARLAGALVR